MIALGSSVTPASAATLPVWQVPLIYTFYGGSWFMNYAPHQTFVANCVSSVDNLTNTYYHYVTISQALIMARDTHINVEDRQWVRWRADLWQVDSTGHYNYVPSGSDPAWHPFFLQTDGINSYYAPSQATRLEIPTGGRYAVSIRYEWWNLGGTAPAATDDRWAYTIDGAGFGGYHTSDNLCDYTFGIIDVHI
jgi:hypothetical protein